MSEMIEGVNPLMISMIITDRGRRMGMHPMYYKLHKKKWGRLSWQSPDMIDDYWMPPRVLFYGPTGQRIKTIECKSMKHALELRKECMEKMSIFLRSFRRFELQEMIARNSPRG